MPRFSMQHGRRRRGRRTRSLLSSVHSLSKRRRCRGRRIRTNRGRTLPVRSRRICSVRRRRHRRSEFCAVSSALAGPLGFEPRLLVLETRVLPLNYGPTAFALLFYAPRLWSPNSVQRRADAKTSKLPATLGEPHRDCAVAAHASGTPGRRPANACRSCSQSSAVEL